MIRVLPGVSPVREAANRSVVFPTPEEQEYRFPVEKIRIVGEIRSDLTVRDDDFERDLRQLANEISSKVGVVQAGEVLSVEYPIDDSVKAFVGYTSDSVKRPTAVYLQFGDCEEPREITSKVIEDNKAVDLLALHLRIRAYLESVAASASKTDKQSGHGASIFSETSTCNEDSVGKDSARDGSQAREGQGPSPGTQEKPSILGRVFWGVLRCLGKGRNESGANQDRTAE